MRRTIIIFQRGLKILTIQKRRNKLGAGILRRKENVHRLVGSVISYKSWCILAWFMISKIHFPVYKTTRRIYPYVGWHLKGLCHAICYLFKKLKLVFTYKWSSFAVPINGKDGNGQRTGTWKIGVNVFKFKCCIHVKITGYFMLFAISLKS